MVGHFNEATHALVSPESKRERHAMKKPLQHHAQVQAHSQEGMLGRHIWHPKARRTIHQQQSGATFFCEASPRCRAPPSMSTRPGSDDNAARLFHASGEY